MTILFTNDSDESPAFIMKPLQKFSTLLVICGFECSQNCIFCSTSDLKNNQAKNTHQLMKTIKDGRKNGYRNVEFSGGEVTIRNDIFCLIKYAKDLGYENIGVVSNGRMFYYESFNKRLIECGLTYALISLHGHNQKIQEKISGVPGSFSQTIGGIKNLLKCDIPLAVSTAVNKFNCKRLKKLGDFIYNLGVRYWMISDLIPEGKAKKEYSKLSVPYPGLQYEFKKLNKLANKFNRIHFWYFPLCVFPESFYSNKHIKIIDTKARHYAVRQTGYKPHGITFRSQNNKYYDKYRSFLDICDDCLVTKNCGGIFKDYLKNYPAAQILSLFGSNHLLHSK